jgi:hypothetical protein
MDGKFHKRWHRDAIGVQEWEILIDNYCKTTLEELMSKLTITLSIILMKVGGEGEQGWEKGSSKGKLRIPFQKVQVVCEDQKMHK